MGATGAGKTTVGRKVAATLGADFLDADDLHPASNVEKMRAGVPLDDADRAPWLDVVHGEMRRAAEAGEDLVVACSALKRAYQARLVRDLDDVRFVLLTAPRAVLEARVGARLGHFAGKELVASQLATLEAPPDALVVDVSSLDPEAAAALVAQRIAGSR